LNDLLAGWIYCRDIAAKKITLAVGAGAEVGGTMTVIIWIAMAVIWVLVAAYAYPS
jgi:hypothetical protein